MWNPDTGEHIYLSTACLHDVHDACRLRCKFCGTDCLCLCHRPKGNHRVRFT